MRKQLVLGLLFILGSTASIAQDVLESGLVYGIDLPLAGISKDAKMRVDVYDNVTDGCWINVARVQSAIERQLLDAGYENLTDEDPSLVTIYVSSFGSSVGNGGCAVVNTFEVWVATANSSYSEGHKLTSLLNRQVFRRTTQLTGARSGMSPRILEDYLGKADAFIVDVQKEKSRLKEAIFELERTDEFKARFLNEYTN